MSETFCDFFFVTMLFGNEQSTYLATVERKKNHRKKLKCKKRKVLDVVNITYISKVQI